MRAPTLRNLCTLSSLFCKRLIRNNNIAPSFENFCSESQHDLDSELHLSQLDLASHSSSGGSLSEDADTAQLSAILLSSTQEKRLGLKEIDDEEKEKDKLDIPWIPDLSHGNILLRRKEEARDRKHKWIFKYTSEDRFDRLIKLCADRLGIGRTVNMFGHLGRETGLKEYNALINMYIKKTKKNGDEFTALREINKVLTFSNR